MSNTLDTNLRHGPARQVRRVRQVLPFHAGTATHVPAAGHHVDGVLQAAVNDVQPRPTVMQVLNDAGVARYPRGTSRQDCAGTGS